MKKKREKTLLQKQNKRCIQIRDLIRSYVELENKSEALEEKIPKNDSEINLKIHKGIFFRTTQREICHKQN